MEKKNKSRPIKSVVPETRESESYKEGVIF